MEVVSETHSDNTPAPDSSSAVLEPFFVEALAHPAGRFSSPLEVVDHPRLSDLEKRAILLSWVRDELVVEQVASRTMPELRRQSRIDRVLEALSHFDPLAAGEYLAALASMRGRRPRCRAWRCAN